MSVILIKPYQLLGAGDELSSTPEVERLLIQRGIAEPKREPNRKAKSKASRSRRGIETAEALPEVESATLPKPKRRRVRREG